MTKTNIGEFIAALRKSSGYTQQEVADRLGVSNKTVSSWETGASCPDIALLPSIAELFGVTCDELLRGERIPAGEPPQTTEKSGKRRLPSAPPAIKTAPRRRRSSPSGYRRRASSSPSYSASGQTAAISASGSERSFSSRRC